MNSTQLQCVLNIRGAIRDFKSRRFKSASQCYKIQPAKQSCVSVGLKEVQKVYVECRNMEIDAP